MSAKLIHISTDYVFDGTCPSALTEHDQVIPNFNIWKK
ncbi:MAG: sugar nucleotide-binding protein [Bdellovibrio sp.]